MGLNEIDELFGISKKTRKTVLWTLLLINILAITKPSPNSEACKRMTYPHKVCDNYNNYYLFATSNYNSRYAKINYFGILGIWLMFDDEGFDKIIYPFINYN